MQVKTKIINPSAGQIENQVTIQSREVDPEVSNNRSSAFVQVIIPEGGINLSKSIIRTGGEIYQGLTIIIGGMAALIYTLSFQKDKKSTHKKQRNSK